MRWKYCSSEQVIAALWFGLAGCIPTLYFFRELYTGQIVDIIPLGLFAIVTAAVSGYFIGWRILHTDRIWNIMEATLCGLGVTLFAYMVFGTGVAAWFAIPMTSYADSPFEAIMWFVSTLLYGLFFFPFELPFVFLLMFSSGAGADALLYAVRERLQRSQSQ